MSRMSRLRARVFQLACFFGPAAGGGVARGFSGGPFFGQKREARVAAGCAAGGAGLGGRGVARISISLANGPQVAFRI